MGALHAGHLSLVAAARARTPPSPSPSSSTPSSSVPTKTSPTTPAPSTTTAPSSSPPASISSSPPPPTPCIPPATPPSSTPGLIATRLDGASRPGHFRGVATIVTRLFNIVAPDRAYFGQKDAAQVAVLRHIVRDLNLPVSLVVCPIVREPDGRPLLLCLLSSRNRYLSPAERARALILSRALRAAESLAATGETSAETLRAAMLTVLTAPDPDPNLNAVPVTLDYAAVVDPDTLLPLADIRNGALLAVAAHIGPTRLIDNLLLPTITL